ncbi:MAG: phosphatidylinositol mannoside acyltransferase [Geodermatophilaceae bacterium]|nr:phosphatidylinositol mannoside acyltransferase [Geodermatophilaceae bacterium]
MGNASGSGNSASAARVRLALLGAGWSVAKALPESAARGLADRGADRMTRRDGPAVQQLRKNLRRVLGPEAGSDQLEDTVARGVRSYARYWIESLRLTREDAPRVIANTASDTWPIADAARARGRGLIAVLTHSSNWDAYSLLWSSRYRSPVVTVAERLEPPAVFARFLAHRASLGMEVLPLTGGERPVAQVLAERLRANGLVCLLADRDLLGNGLPVTMFGEPTTIPPGPAMLAATTGAALLPMNGSFTERGWRMDFEPEIDLPTEGRLRDRVAAATQAMAGAFERGIAAHPEDWHMLQPIWTADRTTQVTAGAAR